ncbi:E3 ubiquitin-protein ligase isoform X1 [Capsicum galapagoense]
MGNCCCCCCASKRVELNGSPSFYRYPMVPEEREPLSSHHVTAAAFSTALLVDTNLDTSSPDTYRPPPMPMPYETYVGRSRTPPGPDGIKNEAAVQETNSETGGALNSADTPEAVDKDKKESEGNKDSEGNVQTDIQLDAIKEVEDDLEKSDDLKKSNVPVVLPPQEECPICLEEYDAENPKMSTKCEHHFHLSCILEWMERSETCPVCDQETVFNPAIDG